MSPRRWRPRFHRMPAWMEVAAVALACLAAGIGLGVASVHRSGSDVFGDYDSPGLILIGPDQRTLSSLAKGCIRQEFDVQESADAVTVRLHVWPANYARDCGRGLLTATLNAPLGSRRLIDGFTGITFSSSDGSGIRRPSYLTAGFVHRYDTATASGPAGWVQVYTRDNTYAEAIWISLDIGGSATTPAGAISTPITVHAERGLAVPGEIEWTEHGQLFTIRSATYAYAPLSTRELVAIGNSLH